MQAGDEKDRKNNCSSKSIAGGEGKGNPCINAKYPCKDAV